MENKKLNIVKIGLVIFLLTVGVGSVFVNAAYPENSKTADSQLKLIIDTPPNGTSFLEPMPFQKAYINIRVLNQFNYPVNKAVVNIYEIGQKEIFIWRGQTDINGIVYWQLPNVDCDKTYVLKAEKTSNGNYKECNIYLTIRNRHLKLFLSENFVDEAKEFFCFVKDQDNQPVSMAAVNFNGEIKLTNNFGMTTAFKAPWVDEDTTFIVKTSAELRGYDDNSTIITVFNCGDPYTHKIYGQVRDYDFQPLNNVKITVIKGTYSYYVYTNENGEYFLWITPNEGGEFITIIAQLPGYTLKTATRWMDSIGTKALHINFWFNN